MWKTGDNWSKFENASMITISYSSHSSLFSSVIQNSWSDYCSILVYHQNPTSVMSARTYRAVRETNFSPGTCISKPNYISTTTTISIFTDLEL